MLNLSQKNGIRDQFDTNRESRSERVLVRRPGDGAALTSGYSVAWNSARRGPDRSATIYFSANRQTVEQRPISVAILGAGHGGLALAGCLAQQGHRVVLWNRTPARIAPVAELGGIHLTF